MAVELYPHQQKAVDKLSNGKILWGDVGTGKSLTAMAYYVSKVCGGTFGDRGSMRTPTDIYIITTAKKRDSLDWEHEALKFGITPDRENSAGAVRLVVDSWNNIGNYTDVHGAFFIFDEQRLVGSGSWSKAFIHIAKSNKWILLTATPGDTWLDYIPVFIANGFYKNRTEFKRRHVVYSPYSKFPKVERYLEAGRLVRLRNQLLVHMPYERHTKRHSVNVPVEYDKDLFEMVVKKRWHVFEQRPLRDVAELFLVMRKVVNTDSSRLEAVQDLIRTHPRLIVFYNFDYELEILRTLTGMSTPDSSKSGYWTEDLGEGEMWIPAELSEKEALLTGSSRQILSNGSQQQTAGDSKTNLVVQSGSMSTDSLSTFSISEWNGHKHQPIPETDRWVYLVQYVAGAEGWNCIETDAMVFYSQTYSYKNFHQAHGRIDRLNTPFTDLYYYHLMSDSMIDRAISKSLKSKQNFNESDFGSDLTKNWS